MTRAVSHLMDERGFELDWPRRLYRRAETPPH